MASMNTRLNIEKLDGNIVQKHGGSKQVGLKQLGSKQVGFKQLGPGVETGFHGVQDEKRVWFEVELQGAQGDREAEDFQVSAKDECKQSNGSKIEVLEAIIDQRPGLEIMGASQWLEDPVEEGVRCQQCTCEWCGSCLSKGFCFICASRDENSSINVPNPNSFNDPPNVFTHPPQPQTYSCELCGNDSHYGYDGPPRFPLAASIDQSPLQEISLQEMEDLKQHYLDEMLNLSNDLGIKDYRNEKIDIHFRRECEDMIDELKGKFNGMSIEINKKIELQRLEKVAKLSTYTTEPSQVLILPSLRNVSNLFCYDDDDDYDYKENTIPLNEIDSQIPLSNVIAPVLPIKDPDDSLSMGDEHLSTIPETESDEGNDSNHFDAESNLLESLLNRDTSIVYSPKIDSLLQEFTGELAYIDLISPEINEVNFDPVEDIRLVEQLLYDNSHPLDALKDYFEIFFDSNDDCTSSDGNPFYSEDIDYVEASPPDSELVSLEEVKDFDPEDGETDTDILLKIKDDILCEKLLNINLLIAKFESLNENPTTSTDFVLKSPSSFPIPVKEYIKVDETLRNVAPPPGVVGKKDLVIREPEADFFYYNGNFDLVRAKHQLAVKGLSECKASESNIRRNQVKDIVKKVEDYLKTYSSAGIDNSWNTIELPEGNNVVPLRSDTIQLVQNGCSFYGLRSEDQNQHLKDFLKLVDSFDLDGENRERTRLRLF
ncbi:hypothetical protein Tco_0530473 [Tanacetum coccineum]